MAADDFDDGPVGGAPGARLGSLSREWVVVAVREACAGGHARNQAAIGELQARALTPGSREVLDAAGVKLEVGEDGKLRGARPRPPPPPE